MGQMGQLGQMGQTQPAALGVGMQITPSMQLAQGMTGATGTSAAPGAVILVRSVFPCWQAAGIPFFSTFRFLSSSNLLIHSSYATYYFSWLSIFAFPDLSHTIVFFYINSYYPSNLNPNTIQPEHLFILCGVYGDVVVC